MKNIPSTLESADIVSHPVLRLETLQGNIIIEDIDRMNGMVEGRVSIRSVGIGLRMAKLAKEISNLGLLPESQATVWQRPPRACSTETTSDLAPTNLPWGTKTIVLPTGRAIPPTVSLDGPRKPGKFDGVVQKTALRLGSTVMAIFTSEIRMVGNLASLR